MAVATSAQILNGLYAAIYVRSPDKGGYDYWTAGFTAGTLTPGGAATAFATRTEWAASYPPTMTDAAYVDKIYLNVLGIAGDAGGRAFWTANITKGAYTRAVFVSEFIAATIQYDSVADTTSTAAEKTSAVQAQNAINSKVSFNDAWVTTTAVSTNSALTGVSTDATGAAIYTASLDKSVALLAGVTDAATLATQTPKIAPLASPTFTLTTGVDSLTALTTGNDLINGAAGTLGSDLIIDNTTTDADVLTVVGVSGTPAPTITKVETLNISNTTAVGIDLNAVSGSTTLNLSATLTPSAATVLNAKAGAVGNIVAGTNINALSVSTAKAGTGGELKVDAGSAATVTLTGEAGSDTIALTTLGNVTIKAGADAAIETLRLNATQGAATGTVAAATPVVTLDTAKALLTTSGVVEITGASDLQLKAGIAALVGRTVTKGSGKLDVSLSGTIAAGTAATDLSKISADTITLTSDVSSAVAGTGAATLTVIDGTTLATTVSQTDLVIGTAATATINNSSATQTKISGAALTALTINSAAPAAAGVASAVDAAYSTVTLGGATSTLTIKGGTAAAGTTAAVTQDVSIAAGTAATVDASALNGALTYTEAAAVAPATQTATVIKGGSGMNMVTFAGLTTASTYTGLDGGNMVTFVNTEGNATSNTGKGMDMVTFTAAAKGVFTANTVDGDDIITIGNTIVPAPLVSTATFNIDGGVGTDTLKFAAGVDLTGAKLTIANVETVSLNGNATLSAAQVAALGAVAIKGSAAVDNFTIKATAISPAIDATLLKLDSFVDNITLQGSDIGAALKGFATIDSTVKTANSIVGGSGNDTITGGGNADTITGGNGADVMTGANGTDVFNFTAGSDLASAPSDTNFDTITDLVKGTEKLTFAVTPTIVPNTVVNTKGFVDVTKTAAGSTLASHIAYVKAGLGGVANAAAFWSEGTAETYVYVSAGATGTDSLVKLSGVSVVATLSLPAATDDTLATFVTGVAVPSTVPTTGNDFLTGTSGGDTLVVQGLGGNDQITGLDGIDAFIVPSGTAAITDLGFALDTLAISSGATVNATMYGTGTTSKTVSWASGTEVVAGTLSIKLPSSVTTSTIDMKASVSTGTVVIDASNGASSATLKAPNGTNTTGQATIIGGAAADIIAGGSGADQLTGGAGSDTFIFNDAASTAKADTITDFVSGVGGDILDLAALNVGDFTALTPTGATANTSIANGKVFIANMATAIATKNYAGSNFADLFAATGKTFNVTALVNDKALLVVEGTDQTQVYYVNNAADAPIVGTELTLVGILPTLTTSSPALVAANFLGPI